jgi:hypothetical protein
MLRVPKIIPASLNKDNHKRQGYADEMQPRTASICLVPCPIFSALRHPDKGKKKPRIYQTSFNHWEYNGTF